MSLPSAGINHAEVDRSAVDSKQAVVDVQGTSDGFPAMTKQGNMNNNREINEMYWDEMGQ